VVEPGYPFQRSQFDGFTCFPRSAAVDQLSLVESVNGLGQVVIIAVALATYKGFNAGFCQAFAVLDRYVLRTAVAMVD